MVRQNLALIELLFYVLYLVELSFYWLVCRLNYIMIEGTVTLHLRFPVEFFHHHLLLWGNVFFMSG